MQTPTVTIPRDLLAQLTAILAAQNTEAQTTDAQAALQPAIQVPEPEPEPRPDVVLSADDHDALIALVESRGADIQQLKAKVVDLDVFADGIQTDNKELLLDLEECQHHLAAAQDKLATHVQGTLLETSPSPPSSLKIFVRFAPLLIVALIAFVHTAISAGLAAANMIEAIQYLVIGAALGLVIDFITHHDTQPEQLEGIFRNAAWDRRKWLMCVCAIALCVRP
jgi:hypothetical protein